MIAVQFCGRAPAWYHMGMTPISPISPITLIDWTKHYVRQEDGWCGPAVLKMVLSAVGIDKSQQEIVADTNISWWGVDTSIMIAYLSRFFSQLNFKINASITDIESHLNQGHIVIVDWWDDLTDDPADPPDGHYSIVDSINREQGTVKLIDPSHRGIWDMKLTDFENRWYDCLDVDQKIRQSGWLLWLNPSSVKN